MELFKFIFQSFWTFIGFIIIFGLTIELLSVIFDFIIKLFKK
jgi:hypothetical protein